MKRKRLSIKYTVLKVIIYTNPLRNLSGQKTVKSLNQEKDRNSKLPFRSSVIGNPTIFLFQFLQYRFHRHIQPIGIFASGSGKVRLSATTTLNVFSSFAHHVSGVKSAGN